MRVLISLVFLAASSALAVAPGGRLYVRSADTALLKEPKVKAATVMKLQPGDEVTWLGASDKDKEFHAVQRNGKKGFVHRSNLSPNQPQNELDASTNKPMSHQAFAPAGPPPRTVTWAGANAAGKATRSRCRRRPSSSTWRSSTR